jgi:ABC-type lipoprotein export system ATPase subunit
MKHKLCIYVTHDPQIMEQVDEIASLEKINNRALSASDTITD